QYVEESQLREENSMPAILQQFAARSQANLERCSWQKEITVESEQPCGSAVIEASSEDSDTIDQSLCLGHVTRPLSGVFNLLPKPIEPCAKYLDCESMRLKLRENESLLFNARGLIENCIWWPLQTHMALLEQDLTRTFLVKLGAAECLQSLFLLLLNGCGHFPELIIDGLFPQVFSPIRNCSRFS
ncbi:hypothetical protein Ciccas_013897, partial [Cichlidogyrus casuarinus]